MLFLRFLGCPGGFAEGSKFGGTYEPYGVIGLQAASSAPRCERTKYGLDIPREGAGPAPFPYPVLSKSVGCCSSIFVYWAFDVSCV